MTGSRADGWHDLPGGGAVEIVGGVPVRITDKGRWNLDENTLLAEAAELTGLQLTWTRGGGAHLEKKARIAARGITGLITPCLRPAACASTHGASRWLSSASQDPPRSP